MTTLSLAQIPFLDQNGNVSQPWLLYLLQQNTSQVTNSGGLALTASALIVGNGSNDIKALTSLGQAYLTLHGNSGGLPTWATVDLTTTGPTAQVSGRLALSFFPQSTLGVIGVAGSVLTDPAYINAASDDQVLRRSGTSIGFGAVNLASASAVTGVLPAASVGPAGLTTQVQFNDAGALAGNASLTFNKATGFLTSGIGTAPVGYQLNVTTNSGLSTALAVFYNNATTGNRGVKIGISVGNPYIAGWLPGTDAETSLTLNPAGSAVSIPGTLGVTGAITSSGALYLTRVNTQEVQFDGGSSKRWRVISSINGASDGAITLQHTTDGFVANFTNGLAISETGAVTIPGTLGVTGAVTLTTALGVASGGTSAATLTGLLQGNGTSAFTAIANSSTVGQVLRVTGASTYAWGALSLSTAAAVTGVLPSANVGPAGTDTQIQFNDAGVLAGNAGLTFAKASGSVSLGVSNTGTTQLQISNTNAGALAVAQWSVGSNAGSLIAQLQSIAGGSVANITSSMLGGLNIYTTNLTNLGLGVAGGKTDLYIDSTRKVHIATAVTQGSAYLNIFGDATAGFLLLANTDYNAGVAGSGLSIGPGVSSGPTYTSIASFTGGFSAWGDLVLQSGGGHVGIGTTTPGSTLDVKGVVRLSGSSSGYVGLQGATSAGAVTYTLPATDGTKSYGFVTDGAATTSWRDIGGISVVVYGADPTGAADSLAAINNAITAAGSGGHVYFPPGTYKITNAIRPTSNVKLYGAGYASQISYQGTGGITVDWVNGGGSGTEYFMFLNAHGNNRSGTVDTNIEICHLRLTYTSGTQPHGILFMNTTGCSVHHCYVDGGPDLCAFLKSSYYKVTNNYAKDSINCCYDNWDGPHHAVIANNVAVPGANGSGIFVNGISTNTTPTPTQNDGFNMVVCGNTLVAGATNCIQGIYIAGLSVTSTVKYVSVVGNTIKSDGGNVFSRGIDIRQGNYVTVDSNTVVGACSLNGIEIVSDYNVITGNIVNSVTGVGTYGIEVTGNYNMFSGNVLQGNATNFRDTGTGNQNTSNTQASNTINIVQ